MRRRITAALLALTASLLLAPSAPADDTETRTYDTHFLAQPIKDWVSPIVGLGPAPAGGITFVEDDDDDATTMAVDTLMSLIVDTIAPGSWDAGDASIVTRNGQLVIRATTAVHAQVTQLLQALRQHRARRVRLVVETYRASPEDATALLAGGAQLDAERQKLLARWKRLSATRVSAFSGQRVHLSQLQSARYVRSFMGQDPSRLTPVAGELRTGSVIDVRPTWSPLTRQVLVDCRLTEATRAGSRRFTTQLAVGAERAEVTFDQPQIHTRAIRTSVLVAHTGATVVAAIGEGPGAGDSREGAVRLTVLRHLAPAGEADEGGPTKPAWMSIYDLRMLTAAPIDFPSAQPGPSGALFEDDDEPAGLSLDALVELIQSTIAPESWEREGTMISANRGTLFVVNTPEVRAKVRALLLKLERSARTMVLVRSQVVTPGAASRAAFTSSAGGTYQAAAKTDADQTWSDDLAIAALAGQRVHVADTRSTVYLAGYGMILPTAKSPTRRLSIDVRQARWGSVLDVMARRVSDGKVYLTLRRSRTTTPGLRTLTFGKGASVQTPDQTVVGREGDFLVPQGARFLLELGGGQYLMLRARG